MLSLLSSHLILNLTYRGSSVSSQADINQSQLKLLWLFSPNFGACQLLSLIIKTSNWKLCFWAAWKISRNMGIHFVFENFVSHPQYKSVPISSIAHRERKHCDGCCLCSTPQYIPDFNSISANHVQFLHGCYYRDMYVAFTFQNFASILITHCHLSTNLKVVSDYNVIRKYK